MSELISGKEALSKVHECVVQYKCDTDPVENRWTTITDHFWDQYNLGVFLNKDTTWKFRLKPRTITLNGIEVPAPFEPKDGEVFWHIFPTIGRQGYGWCYGEDESMKQFGAWRNEEEIKQVVEALRSILNAN